MAHPANLATNALIASITATSEYSASYDADNLTDSGFGTGAGQDWRSTSTAPQNLDIDFGAAVSFDTLVMGGGGVANALPNSYEVYVSDDGVAWGAPIASGNLANDNTARQWISIPRQTKRYLRFRCLTNHGYGAYFSMSAFQVYDLNGWTELVSSGTVTVTAGTVSNMTDDNFWTDCNDGSTANPSWVTFDAGTNRFYWGVLLGCSSSAYWPRYLDIWTSDTGAEGAWTYRESKDLGAFALGQYPLYTVQFSHVYKARWLRFVLQENGGGNKYQRYNGLRIYTKTPSVPPTPTSLGGGYDATSGGVWLEWALNANSDNPIADQVVEVYRDFGYGYGQIGTTGPGATSYWDPSGAVGYRYKVHATNQYTDLDSLFTSPLTVAAPSGGGAQLGPFETGAWR